MARIKNFLKKPVRSLSGVNVIAIMSKPYPCPHGKCTYCPSAFGVPESYTGLEPAARRALMENYDPYFQVQNRLRQFELMGHEPQKIELIIMGGTFLHQPKEYREWFVKEAIRAMNDYPEVKYYEKNIEEVEKENENAKIRDVGLTFETRPDYGKEKEAKWMLRVGGTRVELGVQTLYDEVYKIVNRGHTVKDVIESTKVLKDHGFKIVYHMMLGLPGTNREMDINAFKKLFEDERFRPDMLKIYPTLVIKGSKLYEEWKKGNYKPITTKEAIERIIEIKKIVPKYVRIMRVNRDIPTTTVDAGIDKSNLRELVHKEMQNRGLKCNCIRCREIGRKVPKGKLELKRYDYIASGGREIFLSFEFENDALVGFLRLRIVNNKAFIRELHIYGQMTKIGEKGDWQHKGYGAKLLIEAERIAREEYGINKISVISGIGVRNYYRKFGYEYDGLYMSNFLN